MLYDTILLLTIVSAIVIGVWLLRAAQRSPPPASIICIDTSSFCLNPQNVEERKSHERKQHISRGVSRQQDELANDSMECPARSGATREAKRGDSRLEGVDFFGLAERSAHADDCGLMFFGPFAT